MWQKHQTSCDFLEKQQKVAAHVGYNHVYFCSVFQPDIQLRGFTKSKCVTDVQEDARLAYIKSSVYFSNTWKHALWY